MVVIVLSALLDPDRRVRVMVPESDGVQVMVVGVPAAKAPPDGEVMGLLCAATDDARAATAVKMAVNFILLGLKAARWIVCGLVSKT